MAGKSAFSTGSKNVMQFSGPPSPMNKTEPPIYRQIIQYSSYLTHTYPHLSNFAISKLIAKEVTDIWKAVNPRLTLLNEITILKKVNVLCFKKAKQINRKCLPAAQKKFWMEKLDSLFDFSSCSYKLPVLSCKDYRVKCNLENCKTQHIICICPLQQKVSYFLFWFLQCFCKTTFYRNQFPYFNII